MEKKKYYGVDWLRTIACMGILLMHIRANSVYEIGGLVYLYRDRLERIRWYVYMPLIVVTFLLYYNVETYGVVLIFLIVLFLGLAISVKGEKSKFVSFISGISMEIYLSHMVMFRVIENYI